MGEGGQLGVLSRAPRSLPRSVLNPLTPRNRYHNEIVEHEKGIWGIGTKPHFAIGQRAILIQTPAGNVLWDCISFLDEATRKTVAKLG